MRRGLQRADGGPLDRGVDLPPVHACGCHVRRAARRRVGGQQVVERAEAADLSAATEAPGRGAEPPDVLGRVAGVGQLPVEDAAQPVRADQEVAQPVVAVHRHRRPGGRGARRQPAHPELERGPHLAERIEEWQRVAERVGRRQPLDGGGVDAVDGGQRRPGLVGQGAAGGGPCVVPQDLARDRLPLQALHHQPAGAELVALAHGDHAGHRHAGRRRGAQQTVFHPDAPVRRAAAVHLHDEGPHRTVRCAELEGAGDTRRAAGQPPQALHGAAEPAPQGGRHLLTAEP